MESIKSVYLEGLNDSDIVYNPENDIFYLIVDSLSKDFCELDMKEISRELDEKPNSVLSEVFKSSMRRSKLLYLAQ